MFFVEKGVHRACPNLQRLQTNLRLRRANSNKLAHWHISTLATLAPERLEDIPSFR